MDRGKKLGSRPLVIVEEMLISQSNPNIFLEDFESPEITEKSADGFGLQTFGRQRLAPDNTVVPAGRKVIHMQTLDLILKEQNITRNKLPPTLLVSVDEKVEKETQLLDLQLENLFLS